MYYVYILKCNDKSLYTGITKDLVKRLDTHNKGKASKYTRSRLPVEYIYTEKAPTRSQALKREWAIKQLKKSDKLNLVLSDLNTFSFK